MDPSWERFRDNVQQAVAAIVAGDARPYTQCWTAREDATLFGAFGGVVRGRREIAARLAAVAGRYVEGCYTRMDILGEAATGELAYLVHVEQIESVDDDGPVVRERRVTHVARREEDGWWIVHQHSDPLVEVQLPPRTRRCTDIVASHCLDIVLQRHFLMVTPMNLNVARVS